MNATGAKRGFTLIDLLVVIVIIAVFVGCIPSALNSSREAGRRASCINNQKMIAWHFVLASTYNNRFPASASVTTASDGRQTVGGWSYLVRLLPFMEYDPLYKTLPSKRRPGGLVEPGDCCRDECPAWRIRLPKRSPAGPHKQSAGITNYKAMGSTTRDSLVMVVNPQATPPYGSMSAILYRRAASSRWYDISGYRPNRPTRFWNGLSHTIFTTKRLTRLPAAGPLAKR